MGDSRLNGLALANLLKHREIYVDKVVNVFLTRNLGVWPLKVGSFTDHSKQFTQLNIFMFLFLVLYL